MTVSHPTDAELPSVARAVIVGGGVAGTSIAFHLARLGWDDVVVLERAELGSGTTYYSAGVVGQLRATETFTRLMRDGVESYRRMAAETGVDPGWHEVGSLRLAGTTDRLEELQRQTAGAKAAGLEMHLLSAAEAHELLPLISTDSVLGAAFIPTDGWIEPANLTLAYAAGAPRLGVQIRTGTRVTHVESDGRRVTGVRTDRGAIRADVVIDAAGYGAAELAAPIGVTLPVVTLEHQYLLTQPIPGARADLPVLRDPDNLLYVRPEAGGLLVGGWERDPVAWGLDGIPADFNARLLPPDWRRFEPIMDGALQRIPALSEAGARQLLNGVDAYTPDGRYLLGPTDVDGFFIATAFCSQGVSLSAVYGSLLARWIADGEPPVDLWETDPRRFGDAVPSKSFRIARTIETVSNYFVLRYPHDEPESARPLRCSPIHERALELGADMGERAGWERPNWFDFNAEGADDPRPAGIVGRHWSPAIAAEVRAVRQRAGVFDISSFTKIEVTGPEAVPYLQNVCSNDVDQEVGTVVYSQALDHRGGIQADMTVTRTGDRSFLVVTGAGAGRRTLVWLAKSATDRNVDVRDVTGSLAAFGIWGPSSRDIVSDLTEADMSNFGFPFLTARDISLANAPALALRVTNVGELGWEFYVSPEYGRAVWDALWTAGQARGLLACGHRALDSLRLEKAYRAAGTDLTPADDPYEAGLGFAVRLDKPTGFLGQAALRSRRTSISRRLRTIVLEDPTWLPLGNEPVSVDGEVVGHVTSAGVGYFVEQAIALAYVESGCDAPGTAVEVDLGLRVNRGRIVDRALYDPDGVRVRS